MSESNTVVAKIETCEVCLSKLEGPELDFGYQPLCDELKASPEESLHVTKYHQNIILCQICFTAHQKYQVPKKELFKPNYHYRASLTKDVLNGMEELAISCSKYKNLNEKSVVLDIGCNDGSLLSIFKNIYNVKTIGVDPTDSIDDALDLDLKIKDYFSSDTIEKINEKYNRVDVITFTNVFAHIEDLKSLLVNLKKIISDETLIIIENHYLGAILESNQFDTFYHEHPRTYSYKSFQFIAKSLGLNLLDAQYVSRYGGNIRVYLGKGKEQSKPNKNEASFSDDFIETQIGIEKWKVETRVKVKNLIKRYGRLRAKAFPGRAAILIKLLKLNESHISAVYEIKGSMKVGHYVPGTRIPILPEAELYNLKDQDKPILNLAWHIPGEVRANLTLNRYNGEVIDIKPMTTI